MWNVNVNVNVNGKRRDTWYGNVNGDVAFYLWWCLWLEQVVLEGFWSVCYIQRCMQLPPTTLYCLLDIRTQGWSPGLWMSSPYGTKTWMWNVDGKGREREREREETWYVIRECEWGCCILFMMVLVVRAGGTWGFWSVCYIQRCMQLPPTTLYCLLEIRTQGWSPELLQHLWCCEHSLREFLCVLFIMMLVFGADVNTK